MLSTQKYYNNIPQKIGSYTLVEVYNDSISDENFQGYKIFPIKDINNINQVIEDTIVNELGQPGDEYQLAILAGHDGNQYNHNIVYAVWYTDEEPTYPAEPIVPAMPAPDPQFNVWQEITVNNSGVDTNATVILTVNHGDIELMINDDYFLIKGNITDGARCTINRDGVSINNIPAMEYIITNQPILKHGQNTIKVNKTNITHIDIQYKTTY